MWRANSHLKRTLAWAKKPRIIKGNTDRASNARDLLFGTGPLDQILDISAERMWDRSHSIATVANQQFMHMPE